MSRIGKGEERRGDGEWKEGRRGWEYGMQQAGREDEPERRWRIRNWEDEERAKGSEGGGRRQKRRGEEWR